MSLSRVLLRSVLGLAPFFVSASSLRAQSADAVLPKWHADSVYSEALGEVRRINISLPRTYGAPWKVNEPFPVLIILDGAPSPNTFTKMGIVNALSGLGSPMFPELIVVGVGEGRTRFHDMTPPAESGEAFSNRNRGGAPAFSKFLTEELVPWLASRYAVAPFTVVQGHSLSGLFAAWLYGANPKIDAVLALSPSLMLNDGADYRRVLDGVRARQKPGHFFLAASDDESPNVARLSRRLADEVQQRPTAATRFYYQRYTDAAHTHVSVLGLTDGLRAIFRPVSLSSLQRVQTTSEEFTKEFRTVRARYAANAPAFGLSSRLPIPFVYGMAEFMANEPDLLGAVPVLCDDLRTSFPLFWQGHACLGLLKLAQKDFAGAEAAYKQALLIAEQGPPPTAVPFLKAAMLRLEEARRRER